MTLLTYDRKVTVKACHVGLHLNNRSAVAAFRGFLFMIATLASPQKKRLLSVLDHASGDKRFKILEVHMKKHQFRQDALIEVLHKAQELFGFLEDDLLLFIAYRLKLPASRVYGVATFYHFFTLKPNGKHTCVVCMGTACYVKGADKVLAAVEEKARIKAGDKVAKGFRQASKPASLPVSGRLRFVATSLASSA